MASGVPSISGSVQQLGQTSQHPEHSGQIAYRFFQGKTMLSFGTATCKITSSHVLLHKPQWHQQTPRALPISSPWLSNIAAWAPPACSQAGEGAPRQKWVISLDFSLSQIPQFSGSDCPVRKQNKTKQNKTKRLSYMLCLVLYLFYSSRASSRLLFHYG